MQNSANIPQRIGEALTGLGTAAQALGLSQMRQLFADANQRTRDGHRTMAKSAGMEDVVKDSGDMGDIIVTGDVHSTQHLHPKQSTLLGKLAPLLFAILSAGGVGAAAGYFLARPGTPPAADASQPVPAAPVLDKDFFLELVPPKKP